MKSKISPKLVQLQPKTSGYSTRSQKETGQTNQDEIYDDNSSNPGKNDTEMHPYSIAVTEQDKELRKKLRNRQSALMARERKKQRLQELEENLAELKTYDQKLKTLIVELMKKYDPHFLESISFNGSEIEVVLAHLDRKLGLNLDFGSAAVKLSPERLSKSSEKSKSKNLPITQPILANPTKKPLPIKISTKSQINLKVDSNQAETIKREFDFDANEFEEELRKLSGPANKSELNTSGVSSGNELLDISGDLGDFDLDDLVEDSEKVEPKKLAPKKRKISGKVPGNLVVVKKPKIQEIKLKNMQEIKLKRLKEAQSSKPQATVTSAIYTAQAPTTTATTSQPLVQSSLPNQIHTYNQNQNFIVHPNQNTWITYNSLPGIYSFQQPNEIIYQNSNGSISHRTIFNNPGQVQQIQHAAAATAAATANTITGASTASHLTHGNHMVNQFLPQPQVQSLNTYGKYQVQPPTQTMTIIQNQMSPSKYRHVQRSDLEYPEGYKLTSLNNEEI